MTEREKEYVCDQLCKYPFMFEDIYLEQYCENCLLNKSRTQLRKEYMQEYYRTKIKPARKIRKEYN